MASMANVTMPTACRWAASSRSTATRPTSRIRRPLRALTAAASSSCGNRAAKMARAGVSTGSASMPMAPPPATSFWSTPACPTTRRMWMLRASPGGDSSRPGTPTTMARLTTRSWPSVSMRRAISLERSLRSTPAPASRARISTSSQSPALLTAASSSRGAPMAPRMVI